jgi:hypothetical protein
MQSSTIPVRTSLSSDRCSRAPVDGSVCAGRARSSARPCVRFGRPPALPRRCPDDLRGEPAVCVASLASQPCGLAMRQGAAFLPLEPAPRELRRTRQLPRLAGPCSRPALPLSSGDPVRPAWRPTARRRFRVKHLMHQEVRGLDANAQDLRRHQDQWIGSMCRFCLQLLPPRLRDCFDLLRMSACRSRSRQSSPSAHGAHGRIGSSFGRRSAASFFLAPRDVMPTPVMPSYASIAFIRFTSPHRHFRVEPVGLLRLPRYRRGSHRARCCGCAATAPARNRRGRLQTP